MVQALHVISYEDEQTSEVSIEICYCMEVENQITFSEKKCSKCGQLHTISSSLSLIFYRTRRRAQKLEMVWKGVLLLMRWFKKLSLALVAMLKRVSVAHQLRMAFFWNNGSKRDNRVTETDLV